MIRRAVILMLGLLLAVSHTVAAAQLVPSLAPRGPAAFGLRYLGSAGPVLPYTAVIVDTGDSQVGNGSADDIATAVAGYVVSDLVKIRNAAGQWVTYQPGVSGASGLAYGANTTGVGPAFGSVVRFRQLFPNDPVYVVSESNGGSTAGKGVTTGSMTASITGNILTPTVGTGAGNTTVTGSGVASGTYMAFGAGGATYYVYNIGTTGYTGGNVASTSMAKYDCTKSWSIPLGCGYTGNSGAINNGARARIAAALASLTNPKIIAWSMIVGTNDAAAAGTAADFQTDLSAFITRIRADFDLSTTPIILFRASTGQTGSTTVRTAANTIAAADGLIYLIDTDAWPKSADAVHWRMVNGLNVGGAAAIDIWQGGGTYIAANDNRPLERAA